MLSISSILPYFGKMIKMNKGNSSINTSFEIVKVKKKVQQDFCFK